MSPSEESADGPWVGVLVDRGWEMMDKLVARGGGGDADEIDTEDNEGRAALDDVVMELLWY